MKRGAQVRDRSIPTRLHRLRIAIKKLRYAADFLRPAFASAAAKPYIEATVRLQGALGAMNDRAVARHMLADLATAARPTEDVEKPLKRLAKQAAVRRQASPPQARAGVEDVQEGRALLVGGPYADDQGESMSDTQTAAEQRIPVTVLTGFLGSGKTTLLNKLLRRPELADTAVIINEFGEIGLDHLLVEKSDDEGMVTLNSGCLCCTVRGDLVRTMSELFLKRSKGEVTPFKRMVVETTGLADPAPILHTLMTDPLLASRYRLDGVVTTVDGVNGASTLDNHEEAVKQAAVADRLLLTKSDIADAAQLARAQEPPAPAQSRRAVPLDLERRDRSQRDPERRPLQSRHQERRRQALAARGGLRPRAWRRPRAPSSRPWSRARSWSRP